MKQIKTCATCSNLTFNPLMNTVVPYCSATDNGMIVPHSSETVSDGVDMIFFRVPFECPLPDDRVLKRRTRVLTKDIEHGVLRKCSPCGVWVEYGTEPDSDGEYWCPSCDQAGANPSC